MAERASSNAIDRPARGGRWGRALVAGMALLSAAGCDDGVTITQLDSSVGLDKMWLQNRPSGLPTEIHGEPWPGATPEDVATRLRAPAGFAADIRFSAVRPGSVDDDRLVLIFNGAHPSDPLRACALPEKPRAEWPTPPTQGFQLYAVFCARNGWMGTGLLNARKQQAGDWTEFVRVTRNLIKAIVTDYSGRDEK